MADKCLGSSKLPKEMVIRTKIIYLKISFGCVVKSKQKHIPKQTRL